VNLVYDLNRTPYPFKDNFFDEVYCSHILEHLYSTYDKFLEIWRILKPNGKLIVKVPHFSSNNTWSDPTHVRPFSCRIFYHNLMQDKYKVEHIKITFKRHLKPLQWIINGSESRIKLWESYLANILPADNIYVVLTPKKL